MKKVLIITYYWPPSGGAGVQRWLKLSKYLAKNGVEVHILTVDPNRASYSSIDYSLKNDIDNKIKVHTTNSFEIINIYAKFVGKKNVPTSGFSNVNNKNFFQKLVNSLRSNFFIPDPRIGWKRFAVKKAIEIINSFKVEHIITTSPPHSTQLIGLELKKRLNIKWLVDFRDPWTDIYYYKILGHSFISKMIDKKLERSVLRHSDKIITVSNGFKSLFLKNEKDIDSNKIKVIPNGYDSEDFNTEHNKVENNNSFIICYTGTMSDQYDPFFFFKALNKVNLGILKIKFQLIGSISENIKTFLEKMNYEVEFISTVPHSEVISYQKNADALLLVIPNIKQAEGITPGKLFEYMASKNKVIAIGPLNSDVNNILELCQAGKTFERTSEEELIDYINMLIKNKSQGEKNSVNVEAIQEYSRSNQALEIMDLL